MNLGEAEGPKDVTRSPYVSAGGLDRDNAQGQMFLSVVEGSIANKKEQEINKETSNRLAEDQPPYQQQRFSEPGLPVKQEPRQEDGSIKTGTQSHSMRGDVMDAGRQIEQQINYMQAGYQERREQRDTVVLEAKEKQIHQLQEEKKRLEAELGELRAIKLNAKAIERPLAKGSMYETWQIVGVLMVALFLGYFLGTK